MCFWFIGGEIEADITENYQDEIENVYNPDETNDSASEAEEKGQRILDLSYIGTQPGIFQDRRGFLEWGRFDIHSFITKHQAEASKRKIFEYFFLDILKTAFQMRKITHILTIISVFFSKIRALFTIFNHIRAEVRLLSQEPLRTHFVDHGNTTIHYLGFFQVLHDKLNTSTNFTYLNFLESPRPKLVEYLQLNK